MKKIAKSVALLLFLCAVAVSAQSKAEIQNTSNSPLSYGIIVDNSGSARTSLEKIIDTAKLIVGENGETDESFLVRFVNSERIQLLEEITKDKEKILAATNDFYIEGGQTAILDAVEFAAKYLKENASSDSPRRKFLVLITDGDERQSRAKLEDVLKYLKENNITVFSIGISNEKVIRKVLDKISSGTNGKVILPKSKFDAAALVKELNALMRPQ